mmetsp:Transcript_26528/g.44841  ORF Transcript_26528/g.44841 Transcript_26528/m.44841 type:complete len:153 (-) Transcript_26528:277-735(-)|eukprot:CAMPEP_0114423526 /NCGR_PEP_ID=MMETSP0103-20121206/6195_1 /TAXON_ID=37642 ORGANISM="Paraphysomonas imperforata, Strain PA2" /NCGR_SAMPLE_ID=MMETSP0103 /ASSEMBLY_ACC=CAM_ASM_000201 /LENGTH=152 /DNA_ID=CAMNT_0001592193 /DNA_START=148 /DNA_END=606 /DNA_ORIENTATION=+
MPTVLHSGYLTKRGHLFPTWKRRYFEMSDDGLLAYYKYPGGAVRGSFQFDKWTVIAPNSFYDDSVGFTLRGNMTCLYIKVDNEEEKEEWIAVLERLLHCVKDGKTWTQVIEGNINNSENDSAASIPAGRNIDSSNRTISDVDIDNSIELFHM